MTELLDARPDPTRRPRRRRGPGSRLVVLLVVLLLLLGAVVVGGSLLVSRISGGSGSLDYEGAGTGEVLIRVDPGDTAGRLAPRLQEQGVVRSAAAFVSAANADPDAAGLQPGTYRLRREMSAQAALDLLLDPAARLVGRVVLPEGVPLAQALDIIAESTDVPIADLRAAVEDPDELDLPDYADGQVEGFLFPATYELQPGAGATEVLKTMVDRYEQAAEDLDLEARARALGRTPYEVVTTASLVEKETAFPADRAKVARVVYNRLDADMPLQFDSTVNYIRTEKKARLSLDDIQVESDYNTYQNKGLPPTPIDSPGEAALEAALQPAAGDYVYFVTTSKSGQSLFTADYDEFVRAKAKAKADGVY